MVTDCSSVTWQRSGWIIPAWPSTALWSLPHQSPPANTRAPLLAVFQADLHAETRGKVSPSLTGHEEQQAACPWLPVSAVFEALPPRPAHETAALFPQGKRHSVSVWLSLRGSFHRSNNLSFFSRFLVSTLCRIRIAHDV